MIATVSAQGFWQPAQAELTAGFVERYFADVPAAGKRGPAMARVFGRDLFPVHAATLDTERAAEKCLNREDLTAALRRALADQLDDLRRAVRVRGV
jgi:aminopeptidase N